MTNPNIDTPILDIYLHDMTSESAVALDECLILPSGRTVSVSVAERMGWSFDCDADELGVEPDDMLSRAQIDTLRVLVAEHDERDQLRVDVEQRLQHARAAAAAADAAAAAAERAYWGSLEQQRDMLQLIRELTRTLRSLRD